MRGWEDGRMRRWGDGEMFSIIILERRVVLLSLFLYFHHHCHVDIPFNSLSCIHFTYFYSFCLGLSKVLLKS